jgi:hypothetical protein
MRRFCKRLRTENLYTIVYCGRNLFSAVEERSFLCSSVVQRIFRKDFREGKIAILPTTSMTMLGAIAL